MRITDKTISKGTRMEIVKLILKEEVLPLIDDQKTRQYAESNLKSIAIWIRDKAEICDEKITIDFLHNIVEHYATIGRTIKASRDSMWQDCVIPKGKEINKKEEKEVNMGHEKIIVSINSKKVAEEVTKHISQRTKEIVGHINQRTEKEIKFVVSKVVVDFITKEVEEKEIAMFTSLRDARKYAEEKEIEKEIEVINKPKDKDVFFKIDVEISN